PGLCQALPRRAGQMAGKFTSNGPWLAYPRRSCERAQPLCRAPLHGAWLFLQPGRWGYRECQCQHECVQSASGLQVNVRRTHSKTKRAVLPSLTAAPSVADQVLPDQLASLAVGAKNALPDDLAARAVGPHPGVSDLPV